MVVERELVVLREVRALRGPNIHSRKPALEAILDIGPYEHRPSNTIPGFPERLRALLPGIAEHVCGLGYPGGFMDRLHEGTYLGHIVEHVALELQGLMGFNVTYGKTRETDRAGVYRLVVTYEEEQPARAALDAALRLTLTVARDEPFDMEQTLQQLQDMADEYRLGPSTASIVAAARARDIPVRRLSPRESWVQLGYGVYQKRIRAAQTSNTSSLALELCQEKPLTNEVLRAAGLPVPRGRPVSSEDEAWAVAEQIGPPVAVKPEAGSQGRGVNTGLLTEEEVRAAYRIALEYGSGVMVEEQIQGCDHRLLVVGDRLIAAARRDPPYVVGDGCQSVAALVEETNQDPRRQHGHSGFLSRIALDETAMLTLRQQELIPDSVPAAGQVVYLRQNANLSTGGTATDVTDQVHPATAAIAVLAAQVIGLDIAGIDIMCDDISRPLSEQDGAIVEVNAAPGLRMHLQPSRGEPRDVGGAIIDTLYPEASPSRIPLLAVTGTNGKTTVVWLLQHLFQRSGRRVGMTCTEGIYIDGERIETGDCSGPGSARSVLMNPTVEVAVLETARGGILREGLGFDMCSVGVVLNVGEDHLGGYGIDTPEQMAWVKQVVAEAVHPRGAAVLNADDPLVAPMADRSPGEVIYFGMNAANPVIHKHLETGGRAVIAEGGHLTLIHGMRRMPLLPLASIPLTAGGTIAFQVQNCLAAAAAAWAAGLSGDTIAAGLATFGAGTLRVPGRVQMVDIAGVQVVVDYGHNAPALRALGEAINALGRRRTITVLALPGDRGNTDLLASLEETVPYSDRYLLYDLHDLRGRRPGEVPGMLLRELRGRRPATMATDQRTAVHRAWQLVTPGDRLLLIADEVEEALLLVEELARDARDAGPVAAGAVADGRRAERGAW